MVDVHIYIVDRLHALAHVLDVSHSSRKDGARLVLQRSIPDDGKP